MAGVRVRADDLAGRTDALLDHLGIFETRDTTDGNAAGSSPGALSVAGGDDD